MKLISAYAPHLREEDDVRKIMLDVLIALSPAVIGAAYFFGWYALFLCIAGAVIGELFDIFVMRYLRGVKDFVPDGSGAVTGLLLAMNVSTRLPFWAFLLGLVFALGIGNTCSEDSARTFSTLRSSEERFCSFLFPLT